MKKGKALRLAGFVTAACATTALVATAAQSTGAWFTDSQAGPLSASSGHLHLLHQSGGAYVEQPPALDLSYANMMPGAPADSAINYKVDVSSGKTDVWLVFDTTASWPMQVWRQERQRATSCTPAGGPSSNPDNGRWADMATSRFRTPDGVAAGPGAHNGTVAFQSGQFGHSRNLGDRPTSTRADVHTNALGHGGSDTGSSRLQPTSTMSITAVFLRPSSLPATLTNGHAAPVTAQLRSDGYMNTQPEPAADQRPVPFKLVATQHGGIPWAQRPTRPRDCSRDNQYEPI